MKEKIISCGIHFSKVNFIFPTTLSPALTTLIKIADSQMMTILILRRLFELDVRAIGVFRLAIGMFAVLDLVGRAMMGMEW